MNKANQLFKNNIITPPNVVVTIDPKVNNNIAFIPVETDYTDVDKTPQLYRFLHPLTSNVYTPTVVLPKIFNQDQIISGKLVKHNSDNTSFIKYDLSREDGTNEIQKSVYIPNGYVENYQNKNIDTTPANKTELYVTVGVIALLLLTVIALFKFA